MAQLDMLNGSGSMAVSAVAVPVTLNNGNVVSEAVEQPKRQAEPLIKAEGAFKTISEVSEELDVPTHVLRFWESRFPQVKPQRMRGGRRYYRPSDIETLKKIKTLLYSQGYTIKGAKKHVKDMTHEIHQAPLPEVVRREPASPQVREAVKAAAAFVSQPVKAEQVEVAPKKKNAAQLKGLLQELYELKAMLARFAAV